MTKPYTRYLRGFEAVEAFCFLVMLPCNFNWLSEELKNLLSLHLMAKRIESGEIVAFGQYDADHKLVGILAGVIENNNWHVHVYSVKNSKCDIADLGRQTQKLFKTIFPDVTKLVGAIPEINRAARIYARRNGFKHTGYDENYFYLKEGKQQKIMIFEKEI